MQIIIEFAVDMLNLPISYNPIIQGFIYETLAEVDSVFSFSLHNKGLEKNRNLPKSFTFGRLEGSYRIKGKEIIFPDKAVLEIRSTDTEFIEKSAAGYAEGKYIKLGTNAAKIEKVYIKNNVISENEIDIFFKSPFVYRVPAEERRNFNKAKAREKLCRNSFQKWIQSGRNADDFNLEICISDCKPKLVHSVFKGIYINAWDVPITLKGNCETLNFLYNAGLGARNSQGYGMFGIKK